MKVENDIICYEIKDGILYSVYKVNLKVKIKEAKEIIDLRHQISNNEKQYWCYNINGLKSLDKESRDYADQNGQELLHACAVVINSYLTKFIFNTFLMIKKPKMHFKAFNDKESAVEWLNKIKRNNELLSLD